MSQIKHILYKFQAKDYLQVGRYDIPPAHTKLYIASAASSAEIDL